jgi:hypothetical protein
MDRAQSEVVSVEAEVVRVDSEADLMEMAERRVKWADGIIQRSLSRLRLADVCAIEGTPYIKASGAYAIARLFGLRISYGGHVPTKMMSEDPRGKFYMYMLNAVVSLPNNLDSVEVVGIVSSRDRFFAMRNGEWRPEEDIDEADLALKCTTVADRKGILKLFGITPTWEDLARHAHIAQSDVQSFSFRKPAAAAAPRQTQKSTSTPKTAGASASASTTTEPSGAIPPKATAAGGQSGQPPANPVETPDTTTASEKPPVEKAAKSSPRQDLLEALKGYCGMKGTPLLEAIKKFTGKPSLGVISEEECAKLVEKVCLEIK